MDEVVSIINNLIDCKLDYEKVINNKKEILKYLKEFSFSVINLKDIDLFANKIFTDCLLAAIVDCKDLFELSLVPYRITNCKKSDKYFGDLPTEIFPDIVYLLFNGDFEAIEKVLLNNSKLIQKGSLFEVYAKLCIENNQQKRLSDFIDKNINKNLYETFKEDVIYNLSKIDLEKAIKYLDKFAENYELDYRMYGYPYEIKNMFFHNVYFNNSDQYSLNLLLSRLNNNFNYKIINYKFLPYEPNDDELHYYLEYEKVEKELLKILKKNLHNEFNVFFKNVQTNELIMSFFYKSSSILKELSYLEQLLAIKKTIEIHLSHKFINTESESNYIYLCDEFSEYIESYYKELELSPEEETDFDKNTDHLFKSHDFHQIMFEYDDYY